MLSIICVFNNKDVLEKTALKGFANQAAHHEIIAIDNRDSSFNSAASALNHGARQAKGAWLLFIHQDVLLLSDNWLESAEKILDQEQPEGWVGVAGQDAEGRTQGFMLDRAALLGNPFDRLREVQTLDECLLIHRNDRKDGRYFDEAVPGWHAYGVEACCAAIREGKKNYVVSAPVWHDSKSTNLEGLADAHHYVWRKHGEQLGKIHTTCGVLPDLYQWAGPVQSALTDRVKYKLQTLGFRLSGGNEWAGNWFEEELELMTAGHASVECLHADAPVDDLEAKSFVAQPKREKIVRHVFRGLCSKSATSSCVVVAPDLTEEVLSSPGAIGALQEAFRKVIVCLNLETAVKWPFAFRKLLQRSKGSRLSYRWDKTPIVIASF